MRNAQVKCMTNLLWPKYYHILFSMQMSQSGTCPLYRYAEFETAN